MTSTSMLAATEASDSTLPCTVEPTQSVDGRTSEEASVASGDAVETTQSFLRWAGGKRWLLYHLPEILGNFKINGYHEPFLGGGAVFFGSIITGHAYLSDLNSDLIEAYVQIRDNYELVAGFLKSHVNTAEHYYAVRASKPEDPACRAARFLYLNRTSYNGIYRVNLKGQYNVPFGNRTWGYMPDAKLLASASRKLQGAAINVSDFEAVIDNVQAGDLVFLDPPYTVAHNNNGFVKYNQRLFSFEDQTRLSKLIDDVRAKDAYYLLTNAAHESIATLFEKGDRTLELQRGNSVGGRKAKRGSATEYVFTNVPVYE
jgi:DNA adenine methylase